jgi:hypothetical protein
MKRSLSLYFILALAITQTAAQAQKVTPEIRSPQENQFNEETEPRSPTSWVDPPSLGPASSGPGVVGPSRDRIADQLNRAELNRLLESGRGLR